MARHSSGSGATQQRQRRNAAPAPAQGESAHDETKCTAQAAQWPPSGAALPPSTCGAAQAARGATKGREVMGACQHLLAATGTMRAPTSRACWCLQAAVALAAMAGIAAHASDAALRLAWWRQAQHLLLTSARIKSAMGPAPHRSVPNFCTEGTACCS